MNEKLLEVFYGTDCLPYKDKELTVHYPILGGAFMGASNTTHIKFYIDNLGQPNATWVAIAKLPNGKKGSKVLETASDEKGNYALLELSSWFTQAKGDLFISLNGYQGGINLSYNDETGLYEVDGTPIIEATGSVKINIAYATQIVGSDEVDEITLKSIYASFGTKLDTDKGIVTIDNTSVNVSGYENGQVFYSKADQMLYKLVSGALVPQGIGIIKTNSVANGTILDKNKVALDMCYVIFNTTGVIYRKVESDIGSGLAHFVNELEFINGSSSANDFMGRSEFYVLLSTGAITSSTLFTKEFYNKSQIDTQFYNKDQADTKFAQLGGNNTFTGSNVFNNSPQTNEQISDASSDTKLTTKKYVKDLMDEHLGDYDTLKGRVDTIEEEIPSQASSSNKLADRDWVNSTVNSLVAFYITKNAQGEPFSTYSELMSATTFYSGGVVRVPTRNDYCLVVADETHPIQANDYTTFNNTNDYVGYYVSYNSVLTLVTHDNKDSLGIVAGTTIAYITNASTCRYIYQGNQWEFQFVVNETPFTSDQIKAINSGINDTLVAQITTNANNITTINGKLPRTKDFVVPTTAWTLVNGKYVAELDAGVDFVIDDNAMKIYTPTSNNDQLLRDTYGINVSSDATTQKFTFTCNIGNSAPSEVINFTIAQFGGN